MIVPDDPSSLYSDNLAEISLTSWGVLHGPPPVEDALTVDLTRALRNPPDDPAVREQMTQLTGLDPVVRQYVLETPGARQLIEESVERVLAQFWGYANLRCLTVNVHVYCQGGRHRSPAVAEEIAILLRAQDLRVRVTHRDIDKPVINTNTPGGAAGSGGARSSGTGRSAKWPTRRD